MTVPEITDNIVIGSGPAGITAAWALIKQGHTVTMLDVGEQLESVKSDLRSRLASVEPQERSPEDFTAYTSTIRSKQIDGIHPFGSDFLFRDPIGFNEGQNNNTIGLRPSFAKGGA